MSDNTEWISAKERLAIPQKKEPAIDKEVSEIVGKPIRVTNPKLINLIVKWKSQENKADDSTAPSNYLDDPAKVKELKETL